MVAEEALTEEPRQNSPPTEKGPRSMRQEEDGTFHMVAAGPDFGRRRFELQMKFFTILAEAARRWTLHRT